MAADLTQIVDSIASSPTVLLDLNNESPFGIKDFQWDPPPLRYSSSSSMLTDGDYIAKSAYSNRVLRITFDQISASQDAWATSWQTLARLIDQDEFTIKYQPTGATSPVFFKCYRAQVPSIENVPGATAYRIPTIEIPAYYASIGLRHDVTAAATVNNDPANGSNGLYFDITGVRGDIAADCLLWTTSGTAPVFAHEVAPPGGVYFVQAESFGGVGADTAIAASNDAAMSGAGNNYTRTTFATVTTLSPRVSGLTLPSTIPLGDYRIWARIRGSATQTLQIQAGIGTDSTSVGRWQSDVVTTSSFSGITTVDLGVLRVGSGAPVSGTMLGLDVAAVPATTYLDISLGRTAGSGNTDVDYLLAIPADTAYADVTFGAWTGTVGSEVFDGVMNQLYALTTAGPYTGSPKLASTNSAGAQGLFVGSLPRLVPNVTNRIYWLQKGTSAKTATASVSLSYWPRYLYVRPAST